MEERYFVGKTEITKEEAVQIEKDNQIYLQSENFEDLKKIKFIFKIIHNEESEA